MTGYDVETKYGCLRGSKESASMCVTMMRRYWRIGILGMSSFESEGFDKKPRHAGARLRVWNESALVIEANTSRVERGLRRGKRGELHDD